MKKSEHSLRQRIMNEALRLFQAENYDQVKIKDICKAANCSESSFYYQFETKNRLLVEIYSEQEILRPERLTELLTIKSPVERLMKIHSYYWDDYTELGVQLCANMLIAFVSLGGGITAQYRGLSEAAMLPLIEQAQKEGEILNPTPPPKLLEAIAAASYGIEMMWASGNGQYDLHRLGRRTFENIYQIRDDLRKA